MKSATRLPLDIKLTLLAHQETLDILNRHASVLANNGKTGTDEFYENFKEFIAAFESSSYDVNYLSRNPSDRTRVAYESLLKCKKYKPSA